MDAYTKRRVAGPAGCLEHVDRAHHVDLGVERRPRGRHAYVDLGGEVEDGLRLFLFEQLGNRVCVADVLDDQLCAPRLRGLDVRPASRREVVQYDHVVAALDQRVDQVGPDEPCASGD